MTVRRVAIAAAITAAVAVTAVAALCTFAAWRITHLPKRRPYSIELFEVG